MTTFLNFYFRQGPPYNLVEYEHVSVSAFQAIVETFPEFNRPDKYCWEVLLRENDPRLAAILTFLQEHGLSPYTKSHPWYRKVGNPSLFLIKKKHEFTTQEYNEAPFLEMAGEIEMGEHKHLHFDSPLLVHIKSKIPPIGRAEGAKGPICTQIIKEHMEAEGFKGFTFTPVVVEGSRQPSEPLWEIWSNYMMPPMCSPLVDDDGTPVIPGHYTNGCHIAETELPHIYRYTSDAIASMASVDAAVTHEDFGPKTKLCEMRRLLVSQRFRQWALQNKIKLDYDPIVVVR
ncbi:MAG: hypothetical protein K9N47_09980 [Prosthecobacter sp.]|uniref:hypothetical protein n=1 Tax=Prosthecobacter sp. TaxID=1965333 RepID=UPI0025E86B12|nr:hypothetical protein [Prosthecobacter sp.]MCF7786442.1 hypothetical protein [Prosthecobacter sp.]